MSIEYRTDARGIRAEQLRGFFEGWPAAPTPATHLRVLEGSDEVVLAVDGASGEVVGFVTALTDGVLSAYLPLLEVRADHRGRGIGTQLVRRVLERLEGLYMVDLTCDPGVQPFYARFGLQASTGACRRDRRAQAGRAARNPQGPGA